MRAVSPIPLPLPNPNCIRSPPRSSPVSSLSVKEDEEEEEEEDEQLLHTQVIRYIPRVPKKAARDTRKKGFARWLVHLYYVVHAALTAAGAGSLMRDTNLTRTHASLQDRIWERFLDYRKKVGNGYLLCGVRFPPVIMALWKSQKCTIVVILL